MKKLSFLLIGVLAFAGNIKDGKYFVNIDYGSLKVYDTKSFEGIKFGYYFYDENIYYINNRIYLEAKKINTSADFYTFTGNLDWLFNNKTNFTPYLGVNIGYLYFEDDNEDYSTNIWGIEGGLFINIKDNLGIDIRYTWQKAWEKQHIWNRALKEIEAGVEFSF